MKRFIVFVLAITMCLSTLGMTTFAAEVETPSNESASLLEKLPADAKILYQSEDAILYQSKSQDEADEKALADNGITPRVDNNYGYDWIEPGDPSGSFNVYNTHTSGDIGVTWKVETSSPTDYVQIWMTNPLGLTVLTTRAVKASDGDVRMVISQGVRGNYTVRYIPVLVTTGMRIMCWTYDV